jgi:DNA-binding transcriptional regulator YiaG
MHQKELFAKQVKEARRRLGLSQSQAATKWGVNLRTLQEWEQAKILPRGETLLRLLPLLQSSPRQSRRPAH